MTRILPAIGCIGLCLVTACGKTSVVPGAPTAVSCALTVTPSSQQVPQGGGSFHAAVSGSCGWSATSEADWIVVTHGSGADVGTITYDVGQNPGAERQGRLMIGDRPLTVRQSGIAVTAEPAPPTVPSPSPDPPSPTPPSPPSPSPGPGTPATCTYSVGVSGTRVPAAGGPLTIDVSTGPTCGWSSASPDAWISAASGARTGSGAFTATIRANTGAARTGRIDVGNTSVAITQEGAALAACTFGLKPSHPSVGAEGGDHYSIDVSTSTHCDWKASSDSDWLALSTPAGTGSGTIRVVARPNAGDPRSARVSVNSAVVVLSQDGCVSDVRVEPQKLPAAASSGRVAVSTVGGCGWSVRTPTWILGAPGGGKGTSTFDFRVEANQGGAARFGTIEIGGRKVEITQAGFTGGAAR